MLEEEQLDVTLEADASEDKPRFSTSFIPKPGDVLVGKYRIEKVVGEGGMGVVFAARHEALDQLVAVKVLLADAAQSDDVIERFVREAQAAARLQSEHVARVFDAGTLDNHVPFLVMEYLDGCDLEELLRIGGGQLAVTDACDYLLQALAAMAQAHAVGIVHRDLKPANLFLAVRPDGSNVIKIVDFGISKQTRATKREKALTGRAVLGSPAYMPPEQLRNAQSVDNRADIWALGVVLYEMLTGVVPFDGEGVGEIFAAILEQDPPSMRAKRPELTPELEAVVMTALRRKVDERFQDVGEFASALAPFCSAKWTPLLETIESTLRRSAHLRAARPATNAADGTERGVANGSGAADEPPAGSPQSAKVAFTRTDQFSPLHSPDAVTRDAEPPVKKRGRPWLVAAVGLVIAGAAAFYARGYLGPNFTPRAVAAPAAPPAEVAPAPTTTLPGAATTEIASTPVVGATDAGTRPPSSAAKAGARKPPPPPRAAPSTKNRPKFLNSRE